MELNMGPLNIAVHNFNIELQFELYYVFYDQIVLQYVLQIEEVLQYRTEFY